jgi:hypothetical protein
MRITGLILLLTCTPMPVFSQTSRELYQEVHAAGGITPLAELVCFADPGQGGDLDTIFTLVAFSMDFESTLRRRGQDVPKEFAGLANVPEKERFLMQWTFSDGVQLWKDPEVLDLEVGSNGQLWSSEFVPKQRTTHKFILRMAFGFSGRYRRDVLVDGSLATSVRGRCEPVTFEGEKP